MRRPKLTRAVLLRIGLLNRRHDQRWGRSHLTAREEELSFTEGLVAAVSYVGLSGWLWLRWRNPIAPSTKILGPIIIATVISVIIVGVIWDGHLEQNILNGIALRQK